MLVGNLSRNTTVKLLWSAVIQGIVSHSCRSDKIHSLNTWHDLLERLGDHAASLSRPRSSIPMSAPLHASPTPDQRQQLRDLRRAPELRPRVRLVVPHENLEGRRLNVLAALAASGTHRHAPQTGRTASHPWKGKQILAFLRHAPCPGARVSRASWSSTTPASIAPGRCGKPGGRWRNRGSGCGTCRPRSGVERH